MTDIAREAGVSVKTVSHVLNGKSGVSRATRERVQAIIQRVGYHPHIGARSLRSAKANCVGITLPAPLSEAPLSQDFFLWLFGRLIRVFGSQGEYICFDISPDSEDSGHRKDYARGLWEQLYRACMVAGPLALDDTTIERIHRWGEPYVAFGRLYSFPECSCAVVDYEEGAYLCTRFLIDRGHKHIAMLKAFSGYQPGLERRRGYLRALEEAGIEPRDQLIQSVTFRAANIANMVHRLLARREVTALIDASGTEDAAGIREGARRAGREPGKDFEILPWTYAKDASVLREACAQLWLPAWEAGAEGMDELARWFRGQREGPIHIVYPPVLQEAVPSVEVPRRSRLFDTLG
ncbi:MAG: LacI family DNA-binding transcriptional regulator [Candidatus Hydrogenedentes bacterium]|nr:LacI family DNA-binding transcriptional regulator [Candidatus Hydrogenedentota bacterium]